VLLPDSRDEVWAAGTALVEDKSGWTICSVLDQRHSLATVLTGDGDHITVDILKTFPLFAIQSCLITVSDKRLQHMSIN